MLRNAETMQAHDGPQALGREEILHQIDLLLQADPTARLIVVHGETGTRGTVLADLIGAGAGPAATAAPSRAQTLDRPAAREAAEAAIRHYQCPDRLAQSPLAQGDTTRERAAAVRALVDEAASRAFGASYAETTLHEVLSAAYLTAVDQHERVALDLHMSRSTYFRKLRQAVARVADELADGYASSAAASFPRERMLSLS